MNISDINSDVELNKFVKWALDEFTANGFDINDAKRAITLGIFAIKSEVAAIHEEIHSSLNRDE